VRAWPAGAPEVGPELDGLALAAAVGLRPADVEAVPAGVAGAGVPFAFLVVRPDAVARAVPAPVRLRELTDGLVGLVVAAVDPEASHAHVRMFAPDVGVAEDPATGSAAVALTVFLVDRGVLAADGQTGLSVAPGAEIGRPSTLMTLVHAEGGRAVRTSVYGDVVPVARGELVALP
jgi:trans-2,3-dihydro-3-hydroxyanthranilate isomerase